MIGTLAATGTSPLRDWIAGVAVVLSLGALILGGINFLRARQLDKRDLFLRIHEELIQPDVVAGRRLLYKIKTFQDADRAVQVDEISTAIYRALAMFDVLALYVESKWIDESTVLEEWSNSLTRAHEPYQRFVQARYKSIQWHSWPHYDNLAKKAFAYEHARSAVTSDV